MEENKMQEDIVLAGAHLQGEDFEQVEESLWEEYFKGEEPNSGMTPERALVHTRMTDKGTAQIVFAFTNLFFCIVLFAGWHISIGFLVGCCFFVGFLMATILMFQVCGAGYDENHVFMQGLLLYFPVNARRLQRVLFQLLWKYIGIQAGIICVPLLINMCIEFRPDKFFITLMAMVLSMLTVGAIIILGSMSRIKAEV